MTEQPSIDLSGLDFDQLKNSLKSYLSNQTQFQDYDMDGSNMNILLGVLAYNSYMNQFYRNLSLNETFIGTSQLRSSAVRRSKELGYVPYHARGAEATISLQIFPEDDPAFITVGAGTKFTSTVDNNTYTFLSLEDTTLTKTDEEYIGNVVIREGSSVSHRYTVSTSEDMNYLLKNSNADLDTLVVKVQTSISDTTTVTYTKADNIYEVTSASEVYFVSENYQELYEVYFGDGVLGKGLVDGNIVILEYNVSNGSAGDGASSFALNGSAGGYTNVVVSTVTSASGGRAKESLESIKFNAPLTYETQNRAVTYVDYQRLITREFSDVALCSVWGGEDNSPPVYGKVFVSAKPTIGTTFSLARKEEMRLLLKKYNMMSVDVQFVDPGYIYVTPSIEIRYDASKTSLSASGLSADIETAIQEYETTQLNTFSARFIQYAFSKKIADVSSSIVSVDVGLRMQKRFVPNTTRATAYNLTFNNPIDHPQVGHSGSISSSAFTYQGKTCYLSCNGYGVLNVYFVSGSNTKTVVLSNAGTVDYETGLVSISSILIEDFAGNELQVYAVPREAVVNSVRNQLMLVSDAAINIYDDASGALKSSVQQVTTLGVDTTTYSSGVTLVTY
jgi:hypothetical protein